MTAVIDSIIEENDTTPMPMFLMGSDQYAHMLYWSYLEEPQKTEDNGDYFEAEHQRWTLQEMFRRNKTAYTNMLMDGKFVKIKFVDEVLKDPDGNTPSIGECHRPEIPSLCARFDYADPKEKKPSEYGAYQWGSVIVTDGYLQSRKHLPVVYDESEWDKPKPLPKTVVAQLKKKYGMEVERMRLGGYYRRQLPLGHPSVQGTVQERSEGRLLWKRPRGARTGCAHCWRQGLCQRGAGAL